MGRLGSKFWTLGLAAVAVVSCRLSTIAAFAPTHISMRRIRPTEYSNVILNEKNGDKSKYKDTNDKRIEDLLKIERLAAENKPPKIFEAVSKTFWAILGLGLLLNAFGYGYVVDRGGFRIDTLENKQFQQELVKGAPTKTGR